MEDKKIHCVTFEINVINKELVCDMTYNEYFENTHKTEKLEEIAEEFLDKVSKLIGE